MRASDGRWLECDTARDVLASLRCLDLCLARIGPYPDLWKWVILATHSAVQGALVAHVTATDGTGALDPESTRRLQGHNEGQRSTSPTLRLLAPSELYAHATGADERSAPRLLSDPERTRAFQKLDELRQEFTHFKPWSHTLEVSGLPRIVDRMMAVIDEVADHGWAFRHLDDLDELRRLVARIRTNARAVDGDFRQT